MWKYDKMEEAQKELLKKNILDLTGPSDAEMGLYTRQCIMHLTSVGSPDITIHITSDGGPVETALHVYDSLRLYKGNKTGIVYGFARSSAAIILQACDKRVCTKHAAILIHHVIAINVSLDVFKNKEKLQKKVLELEKSQKKLYAILCDRTGRSEKEIIATCKLNNDMTAEEALKFGLIDEII